MASGTIARGGSRECRPRSIRMLLALGDNCSPAPASSSRPAFSRTTMRKPWRASASAAVSPPIPAPAMKMVRDAATGRSGGLFFQHAFRRPGLACGEISGKAIQGRAIRADDFVVIAEVEKHMRMIERRIGADAHELLRSDLDHRNAGVVMKVRHDMVGHGFTLDGNGTGAINDVQHRDAAKLKCSAPYWPFRLIPRPRSLI